MNVAVPSVVGTPEITPVDELSVRPAGSAPDDIRHVAPETLEARVTVYDDPAVAFGRVAVVMVMGAGAEAG